MLRDLHALIRLLHAPAVQDVAAFAALIVFGAGVWMATDVLELLHIANRGGAVMAIRRAIGRVLLWFIQAEERPLAAARAAEMAHIRREVFGLPSAEDGTPIRDGWNRHTPPEGWTP